MPALSQANQLEHFVYSLLPCVARDTIKHGMQLQIFVASEHIIAAWSLKDNSNT
jgi:hypothetical protein